MNKTLRELLEDWIEEKRLFSMADLTAATGLSRQAIHRILRPLLLSKRIEVRSAGKFTRYVASSKETLSLYSAQAEHDFFSALEARVDCLRVVRLASIFPDQPTSRKQAELLLLSVYNTPFVVFDFSRIARVGRPFVTEIIRSRMGSAGRFWLLNAATSVQRVFEQEMLWFHQKPHSRWAS